MELRNQQEQTAAKNIVEQAQNFETVEALVFIGQRQAQRQVDH